MATVLMTAMYPVLLSGGGTGNTSLSSILALATELMTWTITQMTAILTFITANPIILILCIMAIVGFAVGFLMRIWHSV